MPSEEHFPDYVDDDIEHNDFIGTAIRDGSFSEPKRTDFKVESFFCAFNFDVLRVLVGLKFESEEAL